MRYFSYQEPVWDEFDEIVGDRIVTLSEDDIRVVKGRLKFGNAKQSAPFPSVVIIFRPPKY